jgi:hypothetical protein
LNARVGLYAPDQVERGEPVVRASRKKDLRRRKRHDDANRWLRGLVADLFAE